MNELAKKSLKIETEFLAGFEANADAAKGKQLRGAIWLTARQDDSDRVRAMMAARRNYDRELLKDLPQNRRTILHGYERRLWFFKRKTGVAVGSVLAPLEDCLDPQADKGQPVSLSDLVDHVRRIAGEAEVPYIVGVCSPSGFTEEAKRSRLDLPNVTLVLIEPRPNGGWELTPVSEEVDSRVLSLFDPEAMSQKLARVAGAIEERGIDLLSSVISAADLARDLQLPAAMVIKGMEEAARNDPELRVKRQDGETVLYRGAPNLEQEPRRMSLVDKIRQMFGGGEDPAKKIDRLIEGQKLLARRRDRIYQDIGKLEEREAELLRQGKESKSQVVRRRLAAQLGQVRKDVAQMNTTTAVLNKQINIISTAVHNLTLIQQGKAAQLPEMEELTETAVEVEEMMERLNNDAEMVEQLETGLAGSTISEDELAILKEFDDLLEPAEPSKEPASKERTSQTAAANDRESGKKTAESKQRELS